MTTAVLRAASGARLAGHSSHCARRARERQPALLPRVARRGGPARRRLGDGVARGAQRGQPRAQLARPALDAAQLRPRGGARVDETARGQRPSISARCATFARSSASSLGGGREPGVEDLAQLGLRGRAQAERQDVGVVPLPRALRPSARRHTAPRARPAPCWRRSTRRCPSSSRRSPARRGPPRRRAPRPRCTTPSRHARRR